MSQTLRPFTTEVSPKWRLPLRLVWLGVTACTVAVFFLNLPTYYFYLQNICLRVECADQQLNAAQALALGQLGMTLQGFAALTVTVNLIFGTVYLVTALLIFVR